LARAWRRWSLIFGLGLGAAFAGWLLMPNALMPERIFRWQRGAWGEQKTQRELTRLKRDRWVVRHDLRWGSGPTTTTSSPASPFTSSARRS
jgi:hypothetical protein